MCGCPNQTTPTPHPPFTQTNKIRQQQSAFFRETLPLHLIKGLHLLPITICFRNTLPFTISRCCGNYSPPPLPPPRPLHLWHNSAVVVIELKSCFRTCWEIGVVQPLTVIALMDLLHQYECVYYLPHVLKKLKLHLALWHCHQEILLFSPTRYLISVLCQETVCIVWQQLRDGALSRLIKR